jgi:hypothetical protein
MSIHHLLGSAAPHTVGTFCSLILTRFLPIAMLASLVANFSMSGQNQELPFGLSEHGVAVIALTVGPLVETCLFAMILMALTHLRFDVFASERRMFGTSLVVGLCFGAIHGDGVLRQLVAGAAGVLMFALFLQYWILGKKTVGFALCFLSHAIYNFFVVIAWYVSNKP